VHSKTALQSINDAITKRENKADVPSQPSKCLKTASACTQQDSIATLIDKTRLTTDMQTALVGVRCLVETQVRQPGQTAQQHWCISASALLGRLPGAWHGMPFSVIVHVSLAFATLPLFRLPHLHKRCNKLMHCVASHGTFYSRMYSSERPAHSAVQDVKLLRSLLLCAGIQIIT